MVVPYSVTTISSKAFANCTSLTSVTLSDNELLSFSIDLFDGCTNLSTINIADKEGNILTTIPFNKFLEIIKQ